MSNSLFRKFAVTTLTAGLLVGAGASGAVASAHTAEKLPYLTGTTIHVGNGQNVPTFDLFALYSQDIDRTSVEFGDGTNQITFDGLGTLTNHFDANGEYTGSTYTDDPNVDASGHKKLSTAFGVTNKFVAQAEGASSSRVYTNLTIVLDDMATHTDAPTEEPVITEGEAGVVLASPVQVGAAAAAGPALPAAPEAPVAKETETPAAETPEAEVVAAPEAPAAEVVEDSGTVAVTEETVAETPAVISTGENGSNLTTDAPKETVREPLADTAVTQTSNNAFGALIASMIGGVALIAGFLGFKSKTAANN